MALRLWESLEPDRQRASADLERTNALVARLLSLALSTPRRAILDMLCAAIEQAHDAEHEYRRLHAPARPYASPSEIEQLLAERERDRERAA